MKDETNQTAETPMADDRVLAPILSLSEGWVNFTRYPCKEGYIDRWIGDCINNPNSVTKSMLSLNSFAEYYRCNGGEWIPKREFKRYFFNDMREEREFFTASEIFTANRFLE